MSPRLNIPCISPMSRKKTICSHKKINSAQFLPWTTIDHNDIPKLNYLSLSQSKGVGLQLLIKQYILIA